MNAVFVELYAGLAAVTLHIAGNRKPPVSRIGSKAGYAHAIADALGARGASEFLLVDADPSVVEVLRAIVSPAGRAEVCRALAQWPESRATWEALREGRREGPEEAARWLYVTAARRGGVGGFKGGHVRRPSVRGFIPTIASLRARVAALDLGDPGRFDVRHGLAGDVWPIPGAVAYLDPPYVERTGYAKIHNDVSPAAIFERWVHAGCRAGLSEGCEQAVSGRLIDVTAARRGQNRRSLTRSSRELLYVGGFQ